MCSPDFFCLRASFNKKMKSKHLTRKEYSQKAKESYSPFVVDLRTPVANNFQVSKVKKEKIKSFKENGLFSNKETLSYIKNTHLVGGVEYNGKNNLRLTVEGYYKKYKNYHIGYGYK